MRGKKIFLSSTCYDLSDVRDKIEKWIMESGNTILRSDTAGFPLDPENHRQDNCLDVVRRSEAFILVQANRYGSRYHKNTSISITHQEFRTAVDSRIPKIIFIAKEIFNRRDSYIRNKLSESDLNKDEKEIFEFISEIQRHPDGYWMTIYQDVSEISLRLSSIREMFRGRYVSEAVGAPEKYGKRLIVRTLIPEIRHLHYLVNGSGDTMSEDELIWCMTQIPDEPIEITMDVQDISKYDGYHVRINELDDSNETQKMVVVRPTSLGTEIKEELKSLLVCHFQ